MNGMPEYDRTIAMFSPDGRLFQVEYAKKTVKQGSTSVGIVCKEGIVLAADKRVTNNLIVPESIEKITKVDEHIACIMTGIISDGRILVEKMRYLAQEHKFTYDSPSDVLMIVKEISDIKQAYTQSGGVRPFGVSLMIGGVDVLGPQLYITDPTGIYFKYYAKAIGEKEEEIDEILNKEYKQDFNINQGTQLAIKALKKVLSDNFNVKRISLAVIENKNQKIRRFDEKEIKEIIKKL